ncbi:sigma-70 family RNA polymerase sigma factor [Halopseudomonas salegens]|uniref:RNA polymerase sigma-70 factor, ECF subfamily n=1 Tax=Halopseudomonas salegens TaxID=1434072 RepID=A0A1H2F8B2_9GAMM|nr:sigma-70 family RNA polymerase sigma factor [Halopseudomonas salegens]SDU03569.1 RNA polymerase sigma-70 factor, ECF subfamily [Halopseudomonas salegens]
MQLAAEPSLDRLYSSHNHWLKAVVYRRVGCTETAADLVQDVFIRLLCKDSIPAMDEPRAYLARIAHGLMVDYQRRQALERAWLERLSMLPEDEMPSPEEHMQIVESLARIDALLDGLKPRVSRVFLLSRLEGLSYPAIARQLDVSLSTVEKDMAQALRHCYHVLMG